MTEFGTGAYDRGTYRSAINEFVIRELVIGASSATAMAELGGHSHGNLAKALRRLRDRGYLTSESVITETDPRIVRRKNYTLTDDGWALASKWGITDD